MYLSANEFNSRSGSGLRIDYYVNAPGHVDVRVYNVTGSTVRTLLSGGQPAGAQSILWDGRDDRGEPLSTGLYLVLKQDVRGREIRKVVVYKR
jgi:flagellar hook assembly protein FlgD